MRSTHSLCNRTVTLISGLVRAVQRAVVARLLWVAVIGMLLGIIVSGVTEAADEYGAEANPAGEPIGGGEGYSRTTCDTVDHLVTNADELLAAFERAEAGQVVYVVSEQVDLTGHTGIKIPDGVTLAGDRGTGGSPGPLLFNDEMLDPGVPPLEDCCLFIAQEKARITGVRIRGSDTDVADIQYPESPLYDREKQRSHSVGIVAVGRNVEVDNCELSNFHWAGVYVNSANIYIHHNYIHDIHVYPVAVMRGAALPTRIEANIIRWIWHAIAASGAPGTGYEAAYNVVIRHNPPASFREGYRPHAFDVHRGYYTREGIKGHIHPAGAIGGDRVIIHHNTVVNAGPCRPVRLRGIPRQIARIHHNWFSEPPGQRDVQMLDPAANMWVYDNVYGPDKIPVGIGEQTTAQILFKNPSPPEMELEQVSGDLALDIEVDVCEGLQLSSVTISTAQVTRDPQKPGRDTEVIENERKIYSGARPPEPGEIVIDTRELPNGENQIKVVAVDNRGVTSTYPVSVLVDN